MDQFSLVEGHLRYGLFRNANLSPKEETAIINMFLGNEFTMNPEKTIYLNEFLPNSCYHYPNPIPSPPYRINHEFKDIFSRTKVGSLLGFIYHRKQGLFIILHNGVKVYQLDEAPLECPMEWMPAISVGPDNQFSLCQDLSFDVETCLLEVPELL